MIGVPYSRAFAALPVPDCGSLVTSTLVNRLTAPVTSRPAASDFQHAHQYPRIIESVMCSTLLDAVMRCEGSEAEVR